MSYITVLLLQNGYTPLMYTIMKGRIEMSRLLLSHGADTNFISEVMLL
jgi:ankyrin repeat protein